MWGRVRRGELPMPGDDEAAKYEVKSKPASARARMLKLWSLKYAYIKMQTNFGDSKIDISQDGAQ